MKTTSKEIVDVVLYTVPLTVEGYYTPEDPMVMYYPDGSGYPGSPSEFELEKILCNNVDITEIVNVEIIDDLIVRCIEKIENNEN